MFKEFYLQNNIQSEKYLGHNMKHAWKI